MRSIDVLKRPLLTEKGSFESDQHKRYRFLVAPDARKGDIKKAVEDLYKVRVVSVCTQNRLTRVRRTRFGISGGKTEKHAIVRVHPEDSIELV